MLLDARDGAPVLVLGHGVWDLTVHREHVACVRGREVEVWDVRSQERRLRIATGFADSIRVELGCDREGCEVVRAIHTASTPGDDQIFTIVAWGLRDGIEREREEYWHDTDRDPIETKVRSVTARAAWKTTEVLVGAPPLRIATVEARVEAREGADGRVLLVSADGPTVYEVLGLPRDAPAAPD